MYICNVTHILSMMISTVIYIKGLFNDLMNLKGSYINFKSCIWQSPYIDTYNTRKVNIRNTIITYIT